MSFSSFANQTPARASFKRPFTFLRTVFRLTVEWPVWSVSSLVKGGHLAGERVAGQQRAFTAVTHLNLKRYVLVQLACEERHG